MRRRSASVRGFTLVELLLSMTIGAMILLAVTGATRAMTQTRERVLRHSERYQQTRRAFEAMVDALGSVRMDPAKDERLIIGRSGGGQGRSDRINLLVWSDRAARVGQAESDQYEVEFCVMAKPAQGDERSGPPVLMCRRDHGLDNRPEHGGVATMLAEGIAQLSFEYSWKGEWFNEWPETRMSLPDAVRVTLVAVDEPPRRAGQSPTVITLSTIVPIRAAKAGIDSAAAASVSAGGPAR
jgi:prepilin-type N-terminal cleavage/methylation domain-containing protein